MSTVNELEAIAVRIMVDVDNLYKEIEQDPHIFDTIDSMPFVNTPLHVAASFIPLHGVESIDMLEHLQFATEIMRLKSSFALKLNREGLTPIHLAIQKGCNEMALHLVEMNKDLVRVKMRGGLTPLHLAIQHGDIVLLTKLLKACPNSIEDETDKGETVLHFAVKYQQFDAFKFLVRSLLWKGPLSARTILNRKDKDDNTILHIAALNQATEAIIFLKKGTTKYIMDLDAANLKGQTALDITDSADIKRILYRSTKGGIIVSLIRIYLLLPWLMMNISLRPVTEKQSNTFWVVATLVATATYQAALSPPGGLHPSDVFGTNPPGGLHQTDVFGTNQTLSHLPSNSSLTEGKSVMSNSAFGVYSTMNTYAFLMSTLTIFLLLPKNGPSIPLYPSIALLILSFYFSMTIIAPNYHTAVVFQSTFWILCFFVAGILVWISYNPQV